MPNEHPEPDANPEKSDQKPATPETKPETLQKPEDSVDASISACADKGKAVCKDQEEADAYTATIDVSRLPAPLQAMAIQMLTSGADREALKTFQEIVVAQEKGKEGEPWPDGLEVPAARLELKFDSKYFSYEEGDDGTRTIKIAIPDDNVTVAITGSRTPEEDIAAQVDVTAADGPHQVTVGAGLNPELGEGHVGATLAYTNKDAGTTVAVTAGTGPDRELAATGRVEQEMPAGTTLTGTLVYAQGTVTGTLDYRGSLGNITLTIGDTGLTYDGRFETEIAPGTTVYAGASGSVGPDTPHQVEATAGAKVDMGSAGRLGMEGYVGRPTESGAKDAGFTVTYEIPL